MIRVVINTCMAIVFMVCNSEIQSNNMKNDTTDFEYNKRVTLTGTYAKSILSKKGEGVHMGHYKIIVNDSLEVILLPPYHKEAVRPKEEVHSFEGKKVSVTGIILENTPLSLPSLEYQPQSVNIPCFTTIESIQLAESNKLPAKNKTSKDTNESGNINTM